MVKFSRISTDEELPVLEYRSMRKEYLNIYRHHAKVSAPAYARLRIFCKAEELWMANERYGPSSAAYPGFRVNFPKTVG